MLATQRWTPPGESRAPIRVHPIARETLARFLSSHEVQSDENLRGMGYSEFIVRAVNGAKRALQLRIDMSHQPIELVGYEQVYGFASAMVEYGEFLTAKDLLSFFEKPYNWQRQYEMWVAWGKPGDYTCDGWKQWTRAMEAPDPDDEEESRAYWAQFEDEDAS